MGCKVRGGLETASHEMADGLAMGGAIAQEVIIEFVVVRQAHIVGVQGTGDGSVKVISSPSNPARSR